MLTPYEKKLIRGTCDLIWEVGNFGCLTYRYHWKVKYCTGQSKGHAKWTLILMIAFLWIQQKWWHKTLKTFKIVNILYTESIDLFHTFLVTRLMWVKCSALNSAWDILYRTICPNLSLKWKRGPNTPINP